MGQLVENGWITIDLTRCNSYKFAHGKLEHRLCIFIMSRRVTRSHSTQLLDRSTDELPVDLLLGDKMPPKHATMEDLLSELRKLQSSNEELKKSVDNTAKIYQESVERLSMSIQKLSDSISVQIENSKVMAERVSALEKKENAHQLHTKSLEERIKKLEDEKRRGNLIVTGIHEETSENLRNIVAELFRDLAVDFGVEEIDTVIQLYYIQLSGERDTDVNGHPNKLGPAKYSSD